MCASITHKKKTHLQNVVYVVCRSISLCACVHMILCDARTQILHSKNMLLNSILLSSARDVINNKHYTHIRHHTTRTHKAYMHTPAVVQRFSAHSERRLVVLIVKCLHARNATSDLQSTHGLLSYSNKRVFFLCCANVSLIFNKLIIISA